jgi:nicotinamidase/pyrazinamidase
LAVPDGEVVVPLANALQTHFDLVVTTQDLHPLQHGSFAANHVGRKPGEMIQLGGLPQMLWPVHCVQDTPGADFVPGLNRTRWARVFTKGTDPEIDSYSGFFDNGQRKATGLGDYLKAQGVQEVYILGLATDYCVKFTALDAVKLGFTTYLIEDACRGVNLNPGDVAGAIQEMKQAGVQVITSDALKKG